MLDLTELRELANTRVLYNRNIDQEYTVDEHSIKLRDAVVELCDALQVAQANSERLHRGITSMADRLAASSTLVRRASGIPYTIDAYEVAYELREMLAPTEGPSHD